MAKRFSDYHIPHMNANSRLRFALIVDSATILGENQYEIASLLSLLAMILRKWFCHCERSDAISRQYGFTENGC
jgi:hypothetical protein